MRTIQYFESFLIKKNVLFIEYERPIAESTVFEVVQHTVVN